MDRNHSEQWYLSVVSGKRTGPIAASTRAALSVMEPFYAGAMLARNLLYSRRICKADHADAPVISVGNLTTGGTGKTPIVAWLASQLQSRGRHPAVLLRGYRAQDGQSDEAMLLRASLGNVPVQTDSCRFRGSQAVLTEHPEVDVFILDDGMQHRRLARHFDLALIDATLPFGYDHVLPRGLLREPMRGLRRINGVIITRASMVSADVLSQIEQRIRAEQRDVPLFYVDFALEQLADANDQLVPISQLQAAPCYAFCGIGNPSSFFAQLRSLGATLVGEHAFADHHPYTLRQLQEIDSAAHQANARFVLMTEKDWVKVADQFSKNGQPVPANWCRVRQTVRFREPAQEAVMMDLILGRLATMWPPNRT